MGEAPFDAPREWIDALGADQRHLVAVGRSKFDLLVELDLPQSELAALMPDMSALAQIPVRGVIVTTRKTTDAQFDFASRFFAPQSGINEDPVTGSAHCALGPWWRDRLNRNPLLAFQASPRGGVAAVEAQRDRVLLRGKAVTVLRGVLLY